MGLKWPAGSADKLYMDFAFFEPVLESLFYALILSLFLLLLFILFFVFHWFIGVFVYLYKNFGLSMVLVVLFEFFWIIISFYTIFIFYQKLGLAPALFGAVLFLQVTYIMLWNTMSKGDWILTLLIPCFTWFWEI